MQSRQQTRVVWQRRRSSPRHRDASVNQTRDCSSPQDCHGGHIFLTLLVSPGHSICQVSSVLYCVSGQFDQRVIECQLCYPHPLASIAWTCTTPCTSRVSLLSNWSRVYYSALLPKLALLLFTLIFYVSFMSGTYNTMYKQFLSEAQIIGA